MCFFKKTNVPTLEDLLTAILQPTSSMDIIGDSTHREIASEGIIDDDGDGSILYHLKLYILQLFQNRNNAIVNEFIGFRFYNIDNGDVLDHLIQQIRTNSLYISSINFNDVIDPLLSVYINKKKRGNRQNRRWFKLLSEAMDGMRVSCFCPEKMHFNRTHINSIENHLMWAHYANKHSGLCIKYRIKPEAINKYNQPDSFCFLAKVQYSNKNIKLQDITLDDALVQKSLIWEYENEYRLIYFSTLENKESTICINDIIPEAIYLGAKISDSNRAKILKELKKLHIPIFQMAIDYNDMIKLTPKTIK